MVLIISTICPILALDEEVIPVCNKSLSITPVTGSVADFCVATFIKDIASSTSSFST